MLRLFALSAAVLLAGCAPSVSVGSNTQAPATSAAPAAAASAPAPARLRSGPPLNAAATIRDLAGSTVGTVTLTDVATGVLIVGDVNGLGLGAHGIHIHETGKCEPPFTTAGGHFNPEQHHHGFRNSAGAHLGDLPNITTPAAGRLHFEFLLTNATIKEKNALVDADGAAIVIHAAGDDYATDPAGASGSRIACGVIVVR